MNLRKIILTAATAAFFAVNANAQDKEIGIFLGAAQYQGDLSFSQMTLGETKPAVGVTGRYYFNPRVDIAAAFKLGWVSGDDANYPETDHYIRNLNFRSHIAELSAVLEVNLLPYVSGSRRHKIAPFVFGGISVFHFSPKTDYNGQTYALQPLGTEGQTLPGASTSPYSLIQPAIPYGAGVKFSLGKLWNLTVDFGQRKTFTDYIDDVSTDWPDLQAMRDAGNDIGADLSDRSDEIKPGSDLSNVPGRGDKTDLDMFDFFGFTLTKTIRKFGCTDF